jgi:hypothetical protein
MDINIANDRLIKPIIYHTVTKTFRHAPMNPKLPSVLLTAPTGVAAINICGTTIHTAVAIPRECGNNVPQCLTRNEHK